MFCGASAARLARGGGAEVGPDRHAGRIGRELGPVKLVRDINGNVNAIGDGINVGSG